MEVMDDFTEQKHLSNMMNEMYKLASENSLCDLTVNVNDENFHLHKCVFAAAGPLLRYLIHKALELSDSGDLKLKLNGLGVLGFKSALAFIYTGRFPKEDSPASLRREFSATCESLSIPYPTTKGSITVWKHPNHDVKVTLMPENEQGMIEVFLHCEKMVSNENLDEQQHPGTFLETVGPQDEALTESESGAITLSEVPDECVTSKDTSLFELSDEVVVAADEVTHSSYSDHAYAGAHHRPGSASREKMFSCNNCGTLLLEQIDEKLNKSGKIKYTCKQCSKVFITMKIDRPKPLRNVIRKRGATNSLKRLKFSRSSADGNSLEVEGLEHVGPSAKKLSFYSPDGVIRPFVCQLCGTCFTRNHSLKVHLETVCMSRAPVKCLGCQKVLASKQSYNGHIRKYHPNEKPGWIATEWSNMIKVPGQKRKKLTGISYQCQNCAAIYMSHHHYTSHRKKCTEVKALKCPYCSRLFQIRKEWEKHIWQHQNGDEAISSLEVEEESEECIVLEGL